MSTQGHRQDGTSRIAVIGAGYWGKNLVRNFHGLNALGAIVTAIRNASTRTNNNTHRPRRSTRIRKY